MGGAENRPSAGDRANKSNDEFNATGLRTTLPEVTGWVEGNSHRVFVASMEDRFGEMGVISILLVDFGDVEEVSIDAFLLSCRVFGYKAEDAILNEVKRRAIANGKTAYCRFVPTYRSERAVPVSLCGQRIWPGRRTLGL